MATDKIEYISTTYVTYTGYELIMKASQEADSQVRVIEALLYVKSYIVVVHPRFLTLVTLLKKRGGIGRSLINYIYMKQ